MRLIILAKYVNVKQGTVLCIFGDTENRPLFYVVSGFIQLLFCVIRTVRLCEKEFWKLLASTYAKYLVH